MTELVRCILAALAIALAAPAAPGDAITTRPAEAWAPRHVAPPPNHTGSGRGGSVSRELGASCWEEATLVPLRDGVVEQVLIVCERPG